MLLLPDLASLRSAVTVTSERPSEVAGVTVAWLTAGPTKSLSGGGAAVSRKVIIPPMATFVGSASVCPTLSRCEPSSKSVTFASGPVGIRTRVSAVAPESTSATVSRRGCPREWPSSASCSWSAPSRLIGWVVDPMFT